MAIEKVLFPSNMVIFHRFRMFISWHQLGYHHVLKSRSITANMELQALPGSSRYSFTQVVIWKIKQLDTQSRLKKPNQVGSTSDVLIIWYSTRKKIQMCHPIRSHNSHRESHQESHDIAIPWRITWRIAMLNFKRNWPNHTSPSLSAWYSLIPPIPTGIADETINPLPWSL